MKEQEIKEFKNDLIKGYRKQSDVDINVGMIKSQVTKEMYNMIEHFIDYYLLDQLTAAIFEKYGVEV